MTFSTMPLSTGGYSCTVAFLGLALPTARQFRRSVCLGPPFNLKPLRMRSFRVHRAYVQASADEELFIHRNASTIRLARPSKTKSPLSTPSFPRHSSQPSSAPSPSSQAPPPTVEEEQFDFVKEESLVPNTDDKLNPPVDKVELPPLNPTSPSGDPPKSKTIQPAIQEKSGTDPLKSDSTTKSTGSNGSPVSVKILPNGNTHRFIDRVRQETARVIMDSHFGSNLRFPTQRETLTLAGDVAFVFAILILLRAGVSSTLRWIHTRVNKTRGIKPIPPYETSVIECMQRPLEFVSLLTVGTFLAEAVSRPLAATGFLKYVRNLRELGTIIAATWFILRWIDRIRARFAADMRTDKAHLDATARFATVATFVISVLISLDTIGINLQTVLAFGGIGGVAIGFAGREIISNFFGGLMIYVTRPFTVGEWVRCIEEEELNGTVEDIGWYLTCIRSWDKRPLYIPNSRFSTLIVENGSRMNNRRIVHTLHLRLEDTPVAQTIVSKMEAFLNSHPALDPKQHRLAYIDSFDDYSMKIWFSCYTKSVFLSDFRTVQQEILLRFHDIIRNEGARLAARNTRDVRPGIDTDKYGPFGKYASFGPKTDLASSSNSPWARSAENGSDVDELNSMYLRSGSTPADVLASGRGMYAHAKTGPNGQSNDTSKAPNSPLSSSTSVAAMAAAAAAAAAALAKRKSVRADNGVANVSTNMASAANTPVEGVDGRTGMTASSAETSNGTSGDGEGNSAPSNLSSPAVPPGQSQSSASSTATVSSQASATKPGKMRISKAPPARMPNSPSTPGEVKNVEDNATRAAGKDNIGKDSHGRADNSDGSANTVVAPVSDGKGGIGSKQMQISKAPATRNPAGGVNSGNAGTTAGNGTTNGTGNSATAPQASHASNGPSTNPQPNSVSNNVVEGSTSSSTSNSHPGTTQGLPGKTASTSAEVASSASQQSSTVNGTICPASASQALSDKKPVDQVESEKSPAKSDGSSSSGQMQISGAPPRQPNTGASQNENATNGNGTAGNASNE